MPAGSALHSVSLALHLGQCVVHELVAAEAAMPCDPIMSAFLRLCFTDGAQHIP